MLKVINAILLGGLLLITSGESSAVRADTTTAPGVAQTPAPLIFEGKVVVVDRAARTITIEIQKRLYLFSFNSDVKVVLAGKSVSLDDLVAGQWVSFRLVETTDGKVQIAAVAITSSLQESEAAGNNTKAATPATSATPQKKGVPAIPAIPSVGSPNRPVVSPYN